MVKAFLFTPDKGIHSYFYFSELCKLMNSPLVAASSHLTLAADHCQD